MSAPSAVRASVAALLLLAAGAVCAGETQLAPVPKGVSVEIARALQARRASLLQQREALLAKLAAHNSRCGAVREDSPLVATCRSEQASLLAEIARYQAAVAEFNRDADESGKRAGQRRKACEAVEQRAARERRQIETLRRTTSMSQEELAEWTRLNAQAQKKAVVAAVKFTLGEYTADLENVRGSVSKLGRQAAYLAGRAVKARRYRTRMRYVARLDATLARLNPQWVKLVGKQAAQTGLDADEAWEVARDTMHHEFRVARKHNAAIREVLEDPGFRDAFTGDDLDTPGLDVLSSLAKEAGEELGKSELGLEQYEAVTGPTIRAFVFVRDASYAALLSGLSTARVLQQSEVAGDLARATASLQKRYKTSIDSLRACRQAAGN